MFNRTALGGAAKPMASENKHYEVMVKQGGRWEIHARHDANGKEAAINEAKILDGQKHVEAVKVIQEVYDPEDGTSREFNVYTPGQSQGAKRKMPPPGAAKAHSAKKEDHVDLDLSKLKIPKKRRSFSSLILRMIGIAAFSAAVAAMFTFFAAMVLEDSGMKGNAQLNMLIIVGLVSFVIAAIPMAIVFLGEEK